MEPTPVSPNIPPAPKKISNFAIAIFMAIVFLGSFTWTYLFFKPHVFQQNVVNNWKTYRNEDFGFEFKYPKDFELNAKVSSQDMISFDTFHHLYAEGGIMPKDGIELTIHFQDVASEVDMNTLVAKKLGEIGGNTPINQKIVDRQQGMTVGYEGDGVPGAYSGSMLFVFVPNKHRLWGISIEVTNLTLSPSVVSLFNQILSTFKFISTSTPQVDTSNWKVYRNGEYGFEVTLTDAWKGYKVEFEPIGSNFGAGTYAFKVPTKDPKYNGGLDYATPMTIGIVQPGYWDNIQKSNGPVPQYLGKSSDGFVFVAWFWQDPPTDLINTNFEVNKVASTFKFISTTTPRAEGKFCGGIAAFQCPLGYECKLNGNYPDSGGVCVKQNN